MRRDEWAGDATVDQLIADLRADGVPLSRTAVLVAVEHPHWASARRAHDGRAYIPPSVPRAWPSRLHRWPRGFGCSVGAAVTKDGPGDTRGG